MRKVKQGEPGVPASAEILRADGEVAISRAFEAVARSGEAANIGAIGGRGSGKTTFLVELARAWLKIPRNHGRALVMDPKAKRRFDGIAAPELVHVVSSVAEMSPANRPPPPGARVIVCRPRVFQGQDLDGEEWAGVARACSGGDLATMTFIDELVPEFCEFCQFKGGAKSKLKKNFIYGREWKLGYAWGTVDLTDVPMTVVNTTSHQFVFNAGGASLDILRRRRFLLGVPDGLVERLTTYPAPPETRGEFVWLQPGIPWDRTIYKLRSVAKS